MVFSYFSQKTGFDIGDNLNECQNLFSGKKKQENTTNLSSAELAQGVVKVNGNKIQATRI